jgi:hypothetical protein
VYAKPKKASKEKVVAEKFMHQLKNPYDRKLFFDLFVMFTSGGASHFSTIKKGILIDKIYRAANHSDFEKHGLDKSDIRKAVKKEFLIQKYIGKGGGMMLSYAFPWLPGPQTSWYKKLCYKAWKVIK